MGLSHISAISDSETIVATKFEIFNERHSYDNRALSAVLLVELQYVIEGKIADDITIENEERFLIVGQQLSCQSQRTS